MTTLTIRLPESIRAKVEELANANEVTVDQFLAAAAAEKVAAMLTKDCLQQESAGASRADFDRVLDAVPDSPPTTDDRLPE